MYIDCIKVNGELTSPWCFAHTASINSVTVNSVIEIAFALLRTIVSERSELAFLVAYFTDPSRTASARTILCIACTGILTLARFLAIFAVMLVVAGTIAFVSHPAQRTKTLARFCAALSTIQTVTRLGTILAERALFTQFLASRSSETRRTGTGS